MISIGESNTVVSDYRHLQQYCSHPSVSKKDFACGMKRTRFASNV